MDEVIDAGRRAAMGAALAAGLTLAGQSAPAAAARPGLFKCTEFLRRAPGLTIDAFEAHWRSERAPLMRALPGLAGLTFNLVDGARSPNAPYDGVIELWFADERAYGHAFDDGDPRLLEALAIDAPRFAAGSPMGFFTREVAIRPFDPRTPRGQAKRIGLVGRQPGTSLPRFFKAWVEQHAQDAANQPGLVAYILNLRSGPRLPDVPWDGYAELWWADWEAFAGASRAIAATVNARLGFFHAHQLLYVQEQVELAPAGSRT